MVSPEIEYEIKILGAFPVLTEAFNRFTRGSSVIRDRSYNFDTIYLDTLDSHIESLGYSLRHRPKQYPFGDSLDLKQLNGEGRSEICIRDDKPLEQLYTELSKHYRQTLPPIDSLIETFTTSVLRREYTALVPIAGKHITLEGSLDRIKYVRNGRVFAEQDELEVEIKPGFSMDLSEVFDYSKNKLTSGLDVVYTTMSKASRARDFLRG